MRSTLLSIAGLLAAAAGAFAQPLPVTSDCTITWSLGWTEGPGGNNDGRLEPGESAVVHLSVSFTNQNGIANFSPPIGTFGSGTIRGLGSGWLDLHGTGGAQGGWDLDQNNGYGVAPLWDVTGQWPGIVNGGADVFNVQLGQFLKQPSQIVTADPVVDIFTGLWTPADYATRTVVWSVAGNPAAGLYASAVMFELSTTRVGGVFVDPENVFFQSVQIPIDVPEPSAALVLASLVAAPRRRCGR